MSCVFQQLSQLLQQVQNDEKVRKGVLMIGLVDSIALILFTAAAYFYYRWWSNHPLYGKNKGPKVYPLVGSYIANYRNKHRLLDYRCEVLSGLPGHTYRHVLPGGLQVFITAHPVNVEYILKTNFENYPKGKNFTVNVHELLGNGIFNADDQLWKIQRKVASHEFSTRSLRDFALDSVARETSERLLPFLQYASKSGQAFDLQDIFARVAFDNICRLGFGVDPACLETSLPDVKFAKAFDTATLMTSERLRSFPRALWTIQSALDIGNPKKLRLAIDLVDEFTMSVIKNRRREWAALENQGSGDGVVKADLLSRFMTLVDNDSQGDIIAELSQHDYHKVMAGHKSKGSKSNSNSKLADVFLRDIIISFVLAGRDTTTSALSWFFWLLSAHPQVEMAILDEIKAVLSHRITSGKDESTLSFEELKNMHYLHSALTESMRLYPPVPADLKTAQKDDVWPDGTVVKAGSVAIYHPYTMGRLEDLWGKDALEFKPERWLKDGVFVHQSPFKYSVFQAGPRICLGKDMVMMQMKLVVASILPKFEVLVDRSSEPVKQSTLTMRIKHGLPVTVRKRATV